MMNSAFSIGATTVWLALVIVFLVIEGLAPGLVSIWFAAGALAAMIASMFNAPFWLQLVWFVVVSAVALAFTRPLAKKYINNKKQPTNADMLLGRECIVDEPIDNIAGTGSVKVSGKIWSARMLDETVTAVSGEHLVVERIEGVKLIVKNK